METQIRDEDIERLIRIETFILDWFEQKKSAKISLAVKLETTKISF